MKMDKFYHTLNEGIPARDKGARPTRYTSLGMDTKFRREGLHLWLTTWKKVETQAEAEAHGETIGTYVVEDSISLHLSRAEAYALVEEINHRLF